MNGDIVFYTVVIVIMIALITTYLIYVIADEKSKITYYKKKLLYDTHWDKYRTMAKKQKRIIFKKKYTLILLKILAFFRGGLHDN